MGVRFDGADGIGRQAVARLLDENGQLWSQAWEGLHPGVCCGADGMIDPAPPRLPQRTAAAAT
jgi:hypothetical protein